MLVIYLQDNLFSWEIIVVFNIIFFGLFILVSRLIIKDERKKNQLYNKNKAKINRNEVVDILIDSYRQPTIFLSRNNNVVSHNQTFNDQINIDAKNI